MMESSRKQSLAEKPIEKPDAEGKEGNPIQKRFVGMFLLGILFFILLFFKRYRLIELTVEEGVEQKKVVYRSLFLQKICDLIKDYEFDKTPAGFICLKIEGNFRKKALLYWTDGENAFPVHATEQEINLLRNHGLLGPEQMTESEIQMQLATDNVG